MSQRFFNYLCIAFLSAIVFLSESLLAESVEYSKPISEIEPNIEQFISSEKASSFPIKTVKPEGIIRFGDWALYKDKEAPYVMTSCAMGAELAGENDFSAIVLRVVDRPGDRDFEFLVAAPKLQSIQLHLDGEQIGLRFVGPQIYINRSHLNSIALGNNLKLDGWLYGRLDEQGRGVSGTGRYYRTTISLNGLWHALRYCGFF